ncbi:hypothetical protein [Streptomyces colonosanans]|nr:hypothetical protein [Streptomyces colonosanans]
MLGDVECGPIYPHGVQASLVGGTLSAFDEAEVKGWFLTHHADLQAFCTRTVPTGHAVVKAFWYRTAVRRSLPAHLLRRDNFSRRTASRPGSLTRACFSCAVPLVDEEASPTPRQPLGSVAAKKAIRIPALVATLSLDLLRAVRCTSKYPWGV